MSCWTQTQLRNPISRENYCRFFIERESKIVCSIFTLLPSILFQASIAKNIGSVLIQLLFILLPSLRNPFFETCDGRVSFACPCRLWTQAARFYEPAAPVAASERVCVRARTPGAIIYWCAAAEGAMLIQVNRHYYLMLFPDDVVCQSAQCRGPQFMAKWPTLRSCSGARRLMQRPPHSSIAAPEALPTRGLTSTRIKITTHRTKHRRTNRKRHTRESTGCCYRAREMERERSQTITTYLTALVWSAAGVYAALYVWGRCHQRPESHFYVLALSKWVICAGPRTACINPGARKLYTSASFLEFSTLKFQDGILSLQLWACINLGSFYDEIKWACYLNGNIIYDPGCKLWLSALKQYFD